MNRHQRRKAEREAKRAAKRVRAFRGTNRGEELRLLDETDGYLMSDAARDGYYENVYGGLGFEEAWSAGLEKSQHAFEEASAHHGSAANYAREHRLQGTELSKRTGILRSLVSMTTSLSEARRFAGIGGRIFTAEVDGSAIVNADWQTNEENELLVANGVRAEEFDEEAEEPVAVVDSGVR